MKRILLMTLGIIVASCISTLFFSFQALAKDEKAFNNKVLSCTPLKGRGEKIIVHGQVDGKCHVSYPKQTIKDPKTNEEIKLDNCYFPFGGDGKIIINYEFCKGDKPQK